MKKTACKGYTLVEAIAAMGLTALIAAIISVTLTAATNQSRIAGSRLKAAYLADGQLEVFLNSGEDIGGVKKDYGELNFSFDNKDFRVEVCIVTVSAEKDGQSVEFHGFLAP